MKKIILTLMFLIIMNACKEENFINVDSLNLDKKKSYLIFRGTDSKEGFIAKGFNVINNDISHVGIAICLFNKWSVYHVFSSVNETSDLNEDSFEIFFSIEDGEVKYAAIYEFLNLSLDENKILVEKIKEMRTDDIKFDKSFSLDNKNNQLYCSEFVVEVLSHVNNLKFNFKPHKVKLSAIEAIYLNKDSLQYYPVDFFTKDHNFALIEEFCFD